jgi:outer membrane lipoprotein SlyB
MNPYQQQVVDVETAEARRQADIAKASRGLGSIGRGTFGGGRQALMEGEADRALATQLGAIQARGSQQAEEVNKLINKDNKHLHKTKLVTYKCNKQIKQLTYKLNS